MSSSPRILVVALDHTPTSAHALTFALDNVVREGDRLVLLSVGVTQDPEWADVVDAAAGVVDPNSKEAESHAQALLQEAEKVVKEKFAGNEQITVVRRPATGTSVHRAIVEVCDSINATMLIVGSRDMPGFKRIMLGSVSDDCAHKAKCAVLIVKDDRPNVAGTSRWPGWARL